MWPVTRTTSSFWICASLPTTWLSIAALPSGLSTALSKSNSTFESSVIFCTCGAGGGGRRRRRRRRRRRPRDRRRRRFRDLHRRDRQRRRVELVGHCR